MLLAIHWRWTFLSFCLCLLLLPVQAQTSSSEYVVSAKELEKAGKLREALTLLEQSLKSDKNNAEGWNQLGMVQYQLGQFANAKKSFQKAISLNAAFAPARHNLAVFLLNTGDYKQALQEAQQLIALDPQIWEAHFLVSRIHLQLDQPEEAERYATVVAQQSPNHAEAQLLLSEALIHPRNAVNKSSNQTQEERRQDTGRRFAAAATAYATYLKLKQEEANKPDALEHLATLQFYAQTNLVLPDLGEVVEMKTESRPQILYREKARYTEEARALKIQGLIVLRAVFAADGTMRHLLVLKGLGAGLNETAKEAARKIRFNPAKVNGKPVSVIGQLEFSFLPY